MFLAGFRPDVLELLKGFDLFALSSLQEGLCTSLVDAMAASKAAVATAVGGVPEVVADGETGFLVPPRDHEAMADRIVALLKDDARRTRMGEAGAEARARAVHRRPHGRGNAAAYERLLAPSAGPLTTTALRRAQSLAADTARCPAACRNPQAFIMPTWHNAKSKRTGSCGSKARSAAVMSAAIFQPDCV